jgi:hypothetical protein
MRPPGKPGYGNAIDMETMEGFPCLPALWLRRAKPGYASATRPAADVVDTEPMLYGRAAPSVGN